MLGVRANQRWRADFRVRVTRGEGRSRRCRKRLVAVGRKTTSSYSVVAARATNDLQNKSGSAQALPLDKQRPFSKTDTTLPVTRLFGEVLTVHPVTALHTCRPHCAQKRFAHLSRRNLGDFVERRRVEFSLEFPVVLAQQTPVDAFSDVTRLL